MRLFQELDEYLDRVRRLQVHSKAKIQSILEGHAAILDGIEARDEVAAMAAMRGHLRKSPDWVEEFRALNAEYFD